ncbi:MAG TPA: hypothetical protein VK747_14820, partial [Blastocatellia bacterium]|nr:hypothetical protein [Blastocatellia bacterium]
MRREVHSVGSKPAADFENVTPAPPLAATPTATYNYDNVNGRGTKELLLSITVGSSYSETYAYDSNKRV